MARPDRDWVRRLDAREQAALKESELFFLRPSSTVQKALGAVGRPLEFLFRKSPAKLQDGITSSIHGVLSAVAEGAEAGSSKSSLIDELCQKLGFELEPWERIFGADFQALSDTSLQKLSTAKNYAAVQGGVTGITGAPGLIADIPSLYFLLFRVVHQIAVCFGHPADSPQERRYLLQVVNVGHHLELRDRRTALLELHEMEDEIHARTGTTEDLQRAMLAKTVQLLARKLTSTLLQRKATQTVAVVGGAVGAVLNRQLVEDVGLTALHAYRTRFLREAAQRR